MRKIWIIWPDRRMVPERTIKVWYNDAVANGEIAEEYHNAHDLQVMLWALSDAGIITLGEPA